MASFIDCLIETAFKRKHIAYLLHMGATNAVLSVLGLPNVLDHSSYHIYADGVGTALFTLDG